ncbi:hypothetical protein V1477_002026, partial [Vespula maculifrons]
MKCVLRELRCVLFEIRSKTEPFTIKIGRTLDFVVISGSPLSPLHNFVLKRNKSCILRELRCALVDIQKETNKIIVK